MTLLELSHNNQTVTFNTLGGDDSGVMCLIEGSRSISDAPIAGRVYDTFMVLGGGKTEEARARFRAAVTVRLDRMAEHVTAETVPSEVVLREQVTGEPGARIARVFGITHTFRDGIADWSLHRGYVEMVVTVERDAVWASEWTYSDVATSVSYGASTFERKAALIDLGFTGGDQPGQVEQLLLTAVNGNAPQLQEAFVGFKQRRGEQDLSAFSPRIDIGGSVNDVGLPNATLTGVLTSSTYWGGNALRVRFADATLETYERSFRARGRCSFANWNNVAAAAYYEQYVGNYRVIGLVRYSDDQATYRMQAGVYGGAFYGSESVTWLDDNYRVRDSAGSEFVDFGELILPGPPSGNAMQGGNPTFIFGAGLVAGGNEAQIILEQVWLMPADNYIHVKHRQGVPYPQGIDIRGDRDGGASAFTSSLAADGKSRIYGEKITDVQTSDGGLYFPHRTNSVAVVVANRTVRVDMENRPRMRTYRG